jgi:hypothetical protein
LGDELETGEDFRPHEVEEMARRLWRGISKREKTALTLDHSARLGQERALRADPWSIIDSVAAEIILHGKSVDER